MFCLELNFFLLGFISLLSKSVFITHIAGANLAAKCLAVSLLDYGVAIYLL